MSAVENIKKILSQTGLYKIGESKALSAEINAYGKAFEIVEEKLEKLLRNMFIMTAEEDIINAKELLFRPEASTASLEKKREMLLCRYGISPLENTKQALEKCFTSAGCKGTIRIVSSGKIALNVEETYGLSKDEVKVELERYMPAHLEYEIIFR